MADGNILEEVQLRILRQFELYYNNLSNTRFDNLEHVISHAQITRKNTKVNIDTTLPGFEIFLDISARYSPDDTYARDFLTVRTSHFVPLELLCEVLNDRVEISSSELLSAHNIFDYGWMYDKLLSQIHPVGTHSRIVGWRSSEERTNCYNVDEHRGIPHPDSGKKRVSILEGWHPIFHKWATFSLDGIERVKNVHLLDWDDKSINDFNALRFFFGSYNPGGNHIYAGSGKGSKNGVPFKEELDGYRDIIPHSRYNEGHFLSIEARNSLFGSEPHPEAGGFKAYNNLRMPLPPYRYLLFYGDQQEGLQRIVMEIANLSSNLLAYLTVASMDELNEERVRHEIYRFKQFGIDIPLPEEEKRIIEKIAETPQRAFETLSLQEKKDSIEAPEQQRVPNFVIVPQKPEIKEGPETFVYSIKPSGPIQSATTVSDSRSSIRTLLIAGGAILLSSIAVWYLSTNRQEINTADSQRPSLEDTTQYHTPIIGGPSIPSIRFPPTEPKDSLLEKKIENGQPYYVVKYGETPAKQIIDNIALTQGGNYLTVTKGKLPTGEGVSQLLLPATGGNFLFWEGFTGNGERGDSGIYYVGLSQVSGERPRKSGNPGDGLYLETTLSNFLMHVRWYKKPENHEEEEIVYGNLAKVLQTTFPEQGYTADNLRIEGSNLDIYVNQRKPGMRNVDRNNRILVYRNNVIFLPLEDLRSSTISTEILR